MSERGSDLAEVPEEEVGDWLALQCAGALQPLEVMRGLRAGLGPRAALALLPARLRPDGGRLREARRLLGAAGGRLLPWGAPGYPPRLAPLPDTAPVLALRGEREALSADAVAIVGSRAASREGLAFARRLAAELSEAGVVVISGLAYGIDAAAHRGALEAGGRSVAVQACGLDCVYPASHRRLADRLASQGAVVTEFPPGMRPRPAFFPLRNRLISGLSRALVVVEARERSGSLASARHALDQGVEVFAAPGPVSSPGHAGSNRLLRDGARVLLETRDLLDELAWPHTPRAPETALALTQQAREVLDALRGGPLPADALTRRTQQSPGRLAAALLELELAAAAVRERDGRWRALR